jgi:hypothetical protein
VLLADLRRDGLPASVRLTAAKGVADPSGARHGDLRARFGRVNELFNFMHTADDPADLIRQLQLISYETGWDWCADVLRVAAVGDPQRHRAAAELTDGLIEQAGRQLPAHDLDLAASLRRLGERTDGWGELARRRGDRSRIEDWLDTLRGTALPPGAARWDVLTVVTSWIECGEPGIRAIIPTTSVEDWRSRL